MDMSKRLFINVIPGKTFLDKLSGTTKVRLFFALIILLIATWDFGQVHIMSDKKDGDIVSTV